MFPGGGSGDGLRGMQKNRRTDVNRVDVRVCQQRFLLVVNDGCSEFPGHLTGIGVVL